MNRILMIFLLAVVTKGGTIAQNTYVHTLPQGWEGTDGNYSPPGSTPLGNSRCNSASQRYWSPYASAWSRNWLT